MYSLLCSKKFYVIFLFLFSPAILFAQNAGIKGIVKTSDGKPAEFVAITLKGTTRGTTVNAQGHYYLKNVPPGTYILTAQLIGLIPQSKNITVNADETLVADFILTENNEQLQEVIVSSSKVSKITGKKSDYVARMPLANLENPQVYTNISKELMQDQLTVDYRSALYNSPGVVPSSSPAGPPIIYLRGFSVSASVRNGMAQQAWTSIDPVNIERSEVIKGPSGTLFGSVITSFGGLLNQVTKKPFDTFKGEVSTVLGSYDLSRITADINTPLTQDKSVLLRVNTAYQNEGSFQNIGHNRTFTIAPSLSYRVDDRLTLLFNAEIYTQNRTQNPYPTFGAGLFTSLAQIPLDYKTTFGGDNIDAQLSARNLYSQAEYQISDHWKSTTQLAYSNNHVERSLQIYTLFTAVNKVTRRITDFGPRDFNSIELQQNFNGEFKIGGLRNRLLTGFDIYTYHGRQNYSPQITYDNIDDISKPFLPINLPKFNNIAAAATYSIAEARQDVYSAYASDVLNITDRLDAMLSLRIDRFNNKPSITNGVAATNNYSQTAFSPKLGLVYQLVKDQLSLFGNYMNGFQNVGPVTQPDGSVSVFKPRQANQLEGGIKAEAFDHKLTATVSYYNINVSNTTYTQVINAQNFTVQDGTQRSKGYEVEVLANPLTGLNIVAGYGKNQNRFTQSTTALVGKLATAAPQNVANLWVSYKFNRFIKNIGVGFGGNYIDRSWFDAANTLEIPSYTILNASVFYDTAKWRLGIKGNNLGNKQYWDAAAAYQMLRQYLASVTFKF